MNCPNCKNPINDNATVCEWCGASCVSSKENEYHENSLDVELLKVLSESPTPLQIKKAIEVYCKQTGYNGSIARNYISTLWYNNFPIASARKRKKAKKDIKIIIFTALFIFLIVFLSFLSGLGKLKFPEGVIGTSILVLFFFILPPTALIIAIIWGKHKIL